MKLKILMASMMMLLLVGCVGTPDSEGWRYGQKNDFLSILKTDKYMSLCNQKPLYEQVKSSKNSKLMTKLLVAYTYNLANSCIDMKHFKASQRAKRARDIDTHFSINYQKVKASDIKMQLKAGQSIEQILKPYIPTIPQFNALIKQYKALSKNKSIEAGQLKKIRLNIERTKLMKANVGTHYTLVNIPEFQLRVVENGKTVLKSKVIVGKTNMQTPIFSEKMKYVQINPQWNVPDSIMRKSYIPKIKANPGWVKAKGMELHKDSYDLRSKKVNPASVDWSKYPKDEKGYIPYKLVQVPSRKNGLGRMKFIFPNRYAVYIHDTQTKSLFKRNSRAFSHGCIRLSKPKTLLKHITSKYSAKKLESVEDWYVGKKTKHLLLNKPLQVHTVYYTAYVDETGALKLFNDIYGFDKSQRLNF
ncbi:MAG: L,D-transpeptidase family protein [Sulfurovum sp.]|nr:L,D-transpeptidase family protein [Sulfurovum sp.]